SHELRLTAREIWFRSQLVGLDTLAGRYTDALRDIRELMDGPAEPRVRQDICSEYIDLLMSTGDFDGASAEIERALPHSSADASGRGTFLYSRAVGELWSGRPARTLETLDEVLAVPGTAEVFSGQLDWLRAWANNDLGRPV